MEKHYSCFTNKECEFFPCHKNQQDFNCLFCYCPLYFMEHCPGNPQYLLNGKGQEIKDCSQCLFPHIPENYEKVLAAMDNQKEILDVSMEELFLKAQSQLEKKSGFAGMDRETLEEHQTIAMYIYEMFFKNTRIKILLQPFSGKCVTTEGFVFGKNVRIDCNLLERLNLSEEDVVSGYFYTFHAPEIFSDAYENLSLLEQCYLENWLISSIDAGRDWTRDYLFRKHNVRQSHYVTDSFGPGYYGMPIESLKQIFQVFDTTPAGITLLENGNMSPLKSSIGMYMVLTKDISHLMGHDCTNCAGSKLGCNACRS